MVKFSLVGQVLSTIRRNMPMAACIANLKSDYLNARSAQELAQAKQSLQEFVKSNPSRIQGFTYDYHELDEIMSVLFKEYQRINIEFDLNNESKGQGQDSHTIYYKKENNKSILILPCASNKNLCTSAYKPTTLENRNVNQQFLDTLLERQELKKILASGNNIQILLPFNSGYCHWYAVEIIIDKNLKKITYCRHDNLPGTDSPSSKVANNTCDKSIISAIKRFFTGDKSSPGQFSDYELEQQFSPYTNQRSSNNNCGPATLLDIDGLANDADKLPDTFANNATATKKQLEFLNMLGKEDHEKFKKEQNEYMYLACCINNVCKKIIDGNKRKDNGENNQLHSDEHQKYCESYSELLCQYNSENDLEKIKELQDQFKKLVTDNTALVVKVNFAYNEIESLLLKLINENCLSIPFYFADNIQKRIYIKDDQQKKTILLPCITTAGNVFKQEADCDKPTVIERGELSVELLSEFLDKFVKIKENDMKVLFPFYNVNAWSTVEISLNASDHKATICNYGEKSQLDDNSQKIIQKFLNKINYNTVEFKNENRGWYSGASDLGAILDVASLFNGEPLPEVLKEQNKCVEKKKEFCGSLLEYVIEKNRRGNNPYFRALDKLEQMLVPNHTQQVKTTNGKNPIKKRVAPVQPQTRKSNDNNSPSETRCFELINPDTISKMNKQAAIVDISSTNHQESSNIGKFVVRTILFAVAACSLLIGGGVFLTPFDKQVKVEVALLCAGVLMLACAGLLLTCLPKTEIGQAKCNQRNSTSKTI